MFVVISFVRGRDGKLTPWLREEVTLSEVRVSDRKAFSSRGAARHHAEGEIEEGADEVSIYELAGIDNAREAIDASKRGAGTIVDVVVRRATHEQILEAELAENEDPVTKEAEEIARRWLQAHAVARQFLRLPTKRKVAKDKDAWLGPKYSTFGEALKSFMASTARAQNFVMIAENGELWPFKPDGDETVRDALLREANRRNPSGPFEKGPDSEWMDF